VIRTRGLGAGAQFEIEILAQAMLTGKLNFFSCFPQTFQQLNNSNFEKNQISVVLLLSCYCDDVPNQLI
jgi:hypothetical protein